jgi:archaeosine synthase
LNINPPIKYYSDTVFPKLGKGKSMFEVLNRNGLARVGKWLLEEQEKEVKTPNLLFISGAEIKAPEEAEAIISHEKPSKDKPYILSSPSFFLDQSEDVKESLVSPCLFYPLSQEDLNAYASEVNKKNFSGKVFVVCGKGDAVDKAVEGIDAEVYVLTNSMHLIRNPKTFVNSIAKLRKKIGFQKIIYTPGLGNPHHIALLAYCGIDLFDSVPLLLNTRLGYYLTPQGRLSKDEVPETFCYCPYCQKGKIDYDSILGHNYLASLSEIRLVRNSIRNGQLRELVESRMRSEPWMVSALRIFDTQFYEFQERHLPVTGGNFIAASNESLFRPEIVRFRKRIKERYKKPPHKKLLLLLPCSAKKPYSISKTHKAFRRAIVESGKQTLVHEVIITSPLGVVPRELELFYPAQNYDIPVTRTWSKDEISMIGECIDEFLKVNKYDETVVHLPEDYRFVKDHLGDFTETCIDSPSSNKSIERLGEILKEKLKSNKKVDKKTELNESIKNFARFQFGEAGKDLVNDTVIKGRYPNLRIFRDEQQLGMLVGPRGLISLTLEGGKILAEKNKYWVKIDDFIPKGNIFAVGVLDADKDIRIDDDVVVLRDSEMIGVGVAQMSPWEIIQSNRGEAVRIRHLVK